MNRPLNHKLSCSLRSGEPGARDQRDASSAADGDFPKAYDANLPGLRTSATEPLPLAPV